MKNFNNEINNYYINNILKEIFRDINVWKATKYISPNFVVKATRKRFRAKINPKTLLMSMPVSQTEGICEICLTFGNPNYEERKFIKLCKKGKEIFPIKKIQINRNIK